MLSCRLGSFGVSAGIRTLLSVRLFVSIIWNGWVRIPPGPATHS
jgi:hypothetical protein